MMTKRSMKLIIVSILLGLMALGFILLEETEMEVSVNGSVCNYSSTGIWLTVTESGKQNAYSLPPDHCTNFFTQDVEAIWGRNCNTDPCKYQAWKVGAGRFEVDNNGDSSLGFALRIRGWGAGSRWHITPEWPRPVLSTINYSLIR